MPNNNEDFKSAIPNTGNMSFVKNSSSGAMELKSPISNEMPIVRERRGAVEQSTQIDYFKSVLSGGDGFYKKAQVMSGASASSSYKGSGDTVRQAPEIYSPLWLNSNMSLPRDPVTVNAWARAFFTLNPIVHNAIDLHSKYPISRLNIKCKDKYIEDFFNSMIEEIDLMNICIQIAQEYWLLGEAFVTGDWNPGRGQWNRLVIQNPDFIVVKRTVGEPIIMIKPDEHLKRIVNSNNAADIEQRKMFPNEMVKAIRNGKNMVLDNFHVSHIARKISPYHIRGTGLPVTIFKQLMLMDQIRECKYVQYQDMVNPMRIIKIGSTEFKPTPDVLDAYRIAFEEASYDKNFKIFTHNDVAVETVGMGGGIYDTSNDYQQLLKEVYIGMMVPQVIVEGGGDITYQNGQVSLDVLKGRYMSFRSILAQWLKRKIFAPVSEVQGFYDKEHGQNKLIIPEVEWNHMSLFDTGDYINQLVQLSSGEDEQKRASVQTLYRSMGMDWDEERRKIRREAIQTAILKKEKQAMEAMSLSELRALTDDIEINEQEDNEGVPGQDTGGPGGGDMPPPPPPPPPDMGMPPS